MDRQYNMPSVAWLKMTDYMHGWLQYELGCSLRIGEQRVVCVQDLPGARDVLRMETVEEALTPKPVGNCMSAAWKNCIEAGLSLDPDVTERMYGITGNSLRLFVPIECPKRCLTENGVLRPWTLNVNFSHRQATSMQRLLREAFWDAVKEFNEAYARKADGRKYAAIDMIEAFCEQTSTPDIHVESIRREWQRRAKRMNSAEEKAISSGCRP